MKDVHSEVKIITPTREGIGVIVAVLPKRDIPRETILTAKHVVEGCETVEVMFADGSTAEGSVGMLSDYPEEDIAIIRVDSSDISKETLDFISSAQIVSESKENYRPEGFIMYPLHIGNGRYSTVEGTIESMNEYFYEFDSTMIRGRVSGIEEGMSGSPLFDEDGRVFGILVAGNDDGTIAAVNISGLEIE